MTRVEINFELERPLDDEAARAVDAARGIYGMGRIVLDDPMHLRVEYDASRLTEADVEAALRRAGIAVRA